MRATALRAGDSPGRAQGTAVHAERSPVGGVAAAPSRHAQPRAPQPRPSPPRLWLRTGAPRAAGVLGAGQGRSLRPARWRQKGKAVAKLGRVSGAGRHRDRPDGSSGAAPGPAERRPGDGGGRVGRCQGLDRCQDALFTGGDSGSSEGKAQGPKGGGNAVKVSAGGGGARALRPSTRRPVPLATAPLPFCRFGTSYARSTAGPWRPWRS